MPELPEIVVFSRDMRKALVGRTIADVQVLQPKCLNVPVEALLQVETTQGWLLFSLGMGGEILLTDRDHLPEKLRLVFDLDDDTCLAVNFWWMGYAHYATDLADHKMTAKLGPNVLDLTLDAFRELLRGRRGGIKSFLLNQSRIAGIGNVYVQDPLFKAEIHPLRKINTLSDEKIEALWRALRETLQQSIDLGGSAWDRNLHNEKGGWDQNYLLVGYREGQPCPACGTTVEKIKTGSTSSYICPACQPLEV
jgi:formamidopyrimidine-DNA glycosylase